MESKKPVLDVKMCVKKVEALITDMNATRKQLVETAKKDYIARHGKD